LSSLPGKYSPHNLIYHAKSALKLPASKLPLSYDFKTLVRESDLVIAIGGDNYCYDMGKGYYPSDAFIRDNAKKYVLFGCSIEPEDVPKGLGNHLKKTFDAVSVRESLSYDALSAFGVNNAKLLHDPAFLLPADDAPEKQNAVGVNVSPLALNCGNADAIMSSYVALVRYILKETDMSVVLTPHVVWKDNDDRLPLTLIKKAFDKESRVTLVPDANALKLKGVISSLRFFVGARTHATIAAYSSCVPTLTAGYSVKARGIAKDLFGQEEGFVVPVQKISDPNDLVSVFKQITDNEDKIKAQLCSIMPEYKNNAHSAVSLLKELLA
ncbi:MAG: polysaccharide pyruvyl transferase family protein, partial [Clostridia bacterium]|nr:polysaccharide pyruvyl transferase family protein [Clostridia bacterium]